jgi:hypothetical protein
MGRSGLIVGNVAAFDCLSIQRSVLDGDSRSLILNDGSQDAKVFYGEVTQRFHLDRGPLFIERWHLDRRFQLYQPPLKNAAVVRED